MNKWQGKMAIPGRRETDKGKPRDTPVWPLEADSRSLHRTKQPRSLNELKWQRSRFGETEAARICGPLKSRKLRKLNLQFKTFLSKKKKKDKEKEKSLEDFAGSTKHLMKKRCQFSTHFPRKWKRRGNFQIHFIRLTLFWYQGGKITS